MKSNSLSILALFGVLALASTASAQSFNVDIQDTASPYGVPPASYGAGAGMPGVWNVKDPVPTTATALLDVTGAVTAVTIARMTGSATGWNSDDLSTSGSDQALLDDIHDLQQMPTTWAISNLAAGNYTLYTYTFGPGFSYEVTSVSVNGGPAQNAGGGIFAGFVQGNTHTVHTVTLGAGGTITLLLTPIGAGTYGNFGGLQLRKDTPASPGTPFCFGNGSGTACPCGNVGAAGNGCPSSVNAAGANLAATGAASVASDTLSLNGTGMPSSSALYFQGTVQQGGGAGTVFGDGLRCAGGQIVRLATVLNAAGSSSYPNGGTPISVKGNNVAGNVRHYQCWYRNADVAFCPPATFNLTNGMSVTWTP